MSWNQHWHGTVDVVFPSLAPFECKPDLHYSDTQQVSAGKHTHTQTHGPSTEVRIQSKLKSTYVY